MCNFENVTMEQIKTSKSYIITTAILQQKMEFTLEEILSDINSDREGEVLIRDLDVVAKLNMLRDNGLIIEHEPFFSVAAQA